MPPSRAILPIPGRELKGIYMAMEFLRANTKACSTRNMRTAITSPQRAKHVIVIGGGDTGTDCVGTVDAPRLQEFDAAGDLAAARRIRARPTTRGRSGPKFTNSTMARKKRRRRFGADRAIYLTTAKNSSATSNGNVKELHICADVEWTKNEQGAVYPERVPGTEKVLPADLVLLAMGFLGPEEPCLTQLGVERDPRSNAKAEYGNFATNVPGVFAAGECRRGQSLVVWAINEGRGAARECDRFLMGTSNLP